MSAGGLCHARGSIPEGMTDFADLVEAFKREAAPLGQFEALFPSVTNSQITDALMDAFAEAQLDGFFLGAELDVDGGTVAPSLSSAGAALVVIYAGIRNARHRIMDQSAKGSATYKAGPVSYQTAAAAGVLKSSYEDLNKRRLELIANARRAAGTPIFMIEGYVPRGSTHNFYGAFQPWELSGSGTTLLLED